MKWNEPFAQRLTGLRRELHQIPEMAFREHKTAAVIARRLTELGIPHQTGVAQTGIVGLIEGARPGNTLLLRADMDALPLQEGGTAPYRSRHNGVMHACGHDAHMAVLLGAAELLMQRRNQLRGNVKLVFQPAEEATGGAQPMIEEGVLEHPKVNAAFAYHIWDSIPAGQVMVKHGGVMASPDHFFITINGRGGHGARPELCVSPIAVGAEIVSALRAITTDTPSVISIGAFNAGNFENIIPDQAVLKGTARTVDEATRQQVYQTIKELVEGIAASHGATAQLDYHFLYPPCVNDDAMVNLFTRVAQQELGAQNVILQQQPDMIGEDFAYFARAVPSCFAKLGGAKQPLHSGSFDVDEAALPVGAALMARFAQEYLAQTP